MTEARDLPDHATTVKRGAAREARESDQPSSRARNSAPWNAPVSSASLRLGAAT
jgi:hypothetical protein